MRQLQADQRRYRFDGIVDAHGRTVEALLMALERDAMAREELWSDVFATAYRRLEELEALAPEQVRSWLLRTAQYLTANAARRSMTRRRLVDRLAREPIQVAPSAEDDYLTTGVDEETVEQFARVRSAWRRLSEADQRVLAMDALGRNGPLIAAELGISHQAARSRLMRARAAFFEAFQHQGAEPP